MASVSGTAGAITVKAYQGDRKTLLAFNVTTEDARQRLAGFTVEVEPPGVPPYYLLNELQFEFPDRHAQDPSEPARSSINAPLHKFRWLHVPGSAHQGLEPAVGRYRYTVTPRYFDAKRSLTPLDADLSVSVDIDVAPFVKGSLAVGFTRGFTQSQAYVRHFGLKAKIRPSDRDLIYDTAEKSGKNATGTEFTYEQQYEWLGFTARDRIFELLDQVAADRNLQIDVFAYDFNEPTIAARLIGLATKKGRVRVILDNAALHHDAAGSKPEDEFQRQFEAKAGEGWLIRGKFGRYAHDKVIIIRGPDGPMKVLTGSTNFSVTGLYVNSNHVLVFDDPLVAATYAGVFDDVWDNGAGAARFAKTPWASTTFDQWGPTTPPSDITFSPRAQAAAADRLGEIVDRVNREPTVGGKGRGSVLFAVMELGAGGNPVYEALKKLHRNTSLFTYGISDTPDGIALYPVGKKTGVLVTGRPVRTQLPAPFDQVPGVGLGHQVHHKFVVCGFNGPDPVVFCGSSNLALKGEQVNGDNLLEIHDVDVATVFAVEALALVDHFNFLDNFAQRAPRPTATVPALPAAAAAQIKWFLGVTDTWVNKYFDPTDLHYVDRELFA